MAQSSRSWQGVHTQIENAALDLYRRCGFDRVTVHDICIAAEVAPATFYRHFGSKDEVVFGYREDFIRAAEACVLKAAALPREEQLAAVVEGFARYLESRRELLAILDEIVIGHPRLMHRTLAVQRDVETVMAAGLERPDGDDSDSLHAQLQAGIAVVVLRAGLRLWRDGRSRSLVRATRIALSELTRTTDCGPVS